MKKCNSVIKSLQGRYYIDTSKGQRTTTEELWMLSNPCLAQDWCDFSASAMELLKSCAKPSKWCIWPKTYCRGVYECQIVATMNVNILFPFSSSPTPTPTHWGMHGQLFVTKSIQMTFKIKHRVYYTTWFILCMRHSFYIYLLPYDALFIDFLWGQQIGHVNLDHLYAKFTYTEKDIFLYIAILYWIDVIPC